MSGIFRRCLESRVFLGQNPHFLLVSLTPSYIFYTYLPCPPYVTLFPLCLPPPLSVPQFCCLNQDWSVNPLVSALTFSVGVWKIECFSAKIIAPCEFIFPPGCYSVPVMSGPPKGFLVHFLGGHPPLYEYLSVIPLVP